MTDAELEALVARLREPDTHDPACPFSRHCYCGDAIHDNVSDDEKLEAAAALTTLRKQRDELREALVDHNDRLRSACQVADRDGRETNWKALRGQLHYTLAEHHETTNAARQALSNMEGE